MISKERFSKIERGDYILLKKGINKTQIREVSRTATNKNCVVLEPLSVVSGQDVVYNYSDIKIKVLAIFKLKK